MEWDFEIFTFCRFLYSAPGIDRAAGKMRPEENNQLV
jgi:hypothetical protein